MCLKEFFLDKGQEQYPHYKFSPLNPIIIVIIKMKKVLNVSDVATKARVNWAWHRDLVQDGKTESCKNSGLPRGMEDSRSI